MPGRTPRGFTLVETLVVIGVIALLAALLLPAAQSAREAARRAQCANNLKQIGLALQTYHDALGCFPPAHNYITDARYLLEGETCHGSYRDRGFLVAILPFIEQAPIFDALNSDLRVFSPDNATVAATVVGTYACPSDPDGGFPRPGFPIGRLRRPDLGFGDPATISSASYAGVYGSELHNAYLLRELGCRPDPRKLWRANGSITDGRPISLASITDGASNTMIVAEKASTTRHVLDDFDPMYAVQENWWFVGDRPDTLCTAFFPPNYYRKVPANVQYHDAITYSASSLHPGGLNVLLADGSVRHLKETIEAAVFSNVHSSPDEPPIDWPQASGVWQKLATRNGREVVQLD